MSEATARKVDPQPLPLRATDLTVVIPTLNERENIRPLLERLDLALAGTRWEVIFVDDDSKDGTPEAVREIGRSDPRVRCLQRIGRRGLSTACIEGVLASASPFVAVMDADLQHDESLLPGMLNVLRHEPYDIVVGSRYVAGGGVGEWDKTRAGMSGLATKLSRLICKAEIADPMSGFFMLRREMFESAVRNLSGQGFKILLDLLASVPAKPRLRELPYQFRTRRYGESKLDTMVAWEFGMLLADKLVGHIVPVRFALFATIGALGVVVDLIVLSLSLAAGFGFIAAQAIATVVAMSSNFFLNNVFTYRDRRLTGWRLWRGLFSFYVICALGAVANVGFAAFVFAGDAHWLAGVKGIPWLASVAGVVVGSVWNYAVSSVFTWKRK
ncbi:MAG: glycosyltransferase family 2 protein [Alphaproteobacteria bacterium]|nr:glycosyltransferase family 2 protein [Alphaproteobacteria bacterium]